nr:proprotein convertase P-domain-containing protein [Herpetosiphon sp.]
MRAVQFTVGDAGVVRSVTLSLTVTHSHVGDLSAVLISPDGKQHDVFWWGSQPSSSVDGTYSFSDTAFNTFFYAAFTVGASRVPPGTYATHTGAGVAQSMTFSFNGRISRGTWYLQVRDQYAGGTTGTVSAASLTLGLDPGWAAVGEAASLGAIPDGLNLGNSARVPGPPLDVRFTVPAGAGTVRTARVSMTLTHSWVGDLTVWL